MEKMYIEALMIILIITKFILKLSKFYI